MLNNLPDFPILEFDPDPKAILEPGQLVPPEDVPEHCVVCFFAEVINDLVQTKQARKIAVSKSEMGEHPLYEIESVGQRLAFFHPGIGAPLATSLLEEMIARGCRKFIACGGCGVLDRQVTVGHVIIPQTAVRDEGTSYHYLPPSREVDPHPRVTQALISVFKEAGVNYRLGKAWTTDGLYRETKGKRAARVAEGCSVVEMEASALFAVAQFREVMIGEVVYGGDLVVPEGWDKRGWLNRADERRLLFELSVQAARLLV